MNYTETECPCEDCENIQKSKGVSTLIHGHSLSLEPKELERKKRLTK